MSDSTAAAANEPMVPSVKDDNDPVVQYIAIRSDLKWPKGALIAQCCHASVAAIELNYGDEQTREYLRNLDSMHKIVVGVPSETELRELGAKFHESGLRAKLWIEQPENIPTCLATKPYKKSLVEALFKAFKLFR